MDRTVKNLLLPLALLPLCLMPGSPRGPSQSSPPMPDARYFPAGEDLLYDVSWWVVHLGTIRLRVTDIRNDSAGILTEARADIDSYPELPFADLHVVTETVMDSAWNSKSFIGVTEDDHSWRTIRYNYAAAESLLYIERGTTPDRESRVFTPEKAETLAVAPNYLDGLSILYFTRGNLRSGREISVPTVIEGAKGRTVFDFDGERTSEEIDAVEYPVDVIRIKGKAEFSGIFGLSGDFDGWFSNDEARVPICADLEVILGSVRVELIRWRREGWNPPAAPDD